MPSLIFRKVSRDFPSFWRATASVTSDWAASFLYFLFVYKLLNYEATSQGVPLRFSARNPSPTARPEAGCDCGTRPAGREFPRSATGESAAVSSKSVTWRISSKMLSMSSAAWLRSVTVWCRGRGFLVTVLRSSSVTRHPHQRPTYLEPCCVGGGPCGVMLTFVKVTSSVASRLLTGSLGAAKQEVFSGFPSGLSTGILLRIRSETRCNRVLVLGEYLRKRGPVLHGALGTSHRHHIRFHGERAASRNRNYLGLRRSPTLTRFERIQLYCAEAPRRGGRRLGTRWYTSGPWRCIEFNDIQQRMHQKQCEYGGYAVCCFCAHFGLSRERTPSTLLDGSGNGADGMPSHTCRPQ